MISYAFLFAAHLPEAFGIPTTRSGAIHFFFAVTGCLLYLAFALSVRWLPRRLLYRLSLGVLLTVILMSGGCTAWVLSWHR